MITRRVFCLGAILFAGCASPKTDFTGHTGVQNQGAGEYMFVQTSGKKMGYSALELDRIARTYVMDNKVPFDLQDTARNIWVQTDGSPVIAKVFFSGGTGRPVLQVDIDREGSVKRHLITPATKG
jgi:hypothetical protein